MLLLKVLGIFPGDCFFWFIWKSVLDFGGPDVDHHGLDEHSDLLPGLSEMDSDIADDVAFSAFLGKDVRLHIAVDVLLLPAFPDVLVFSFNVLFLL